MQKMTQAEKTMLRYQFVLANTGAAQGDFLRTMNSWHNQLVLLAGGFQQLGSIVGGVLINAFKPFIQALNSVMGSIINFAQVVSDALGAIFGWEYQVGGGVANDMENAAGAAEDMEDATGGAADNAKKLNRYIAAWHEVNNMTSDKDSKGSGAGGIGDLEGLGTADGGKWVQSESLWEKYTSDIDSLYELGDYISSVLTKTLEGIDWEKIYQSARNFGSGLASFLNGLIKPELFGAIGTTIAGALNTALHGLDSFGETFDWKNFGESIASGINNFFSTFDFALLANTIDVWVQGLWRALRTALTKIEWKTVLSGLWDFLSNIDIETIGIIVGAVTIKKIGKFVFGGALFKELAATFGIKLAAELGTAPVVTTLRAGIQALFGNAAAKSALVYMFPDAASVVSAVSAWVTGTLVPTISGFAGTIGAGITGPWGIAIAAAMAGVFAIITNWDTVKTFFTETLPEWWNTTAIPFFQNMFSPFVNVYEEHIRPLVDSFKTGFGEIFESFKSGYDTYMAPVIDALKEKFLDVWQDTIIPLLENFKELFQDVGDLVSIVWEGSFQPTLGFIADAFGEVADAINIFWTDVLQPCLNWIAENIWPLVSPALSDLGSGFVNVFQQIGQTLDGFITATKGVVTFISGVFAGDWEKAWEGVKNVFKGIWDAMPDFVKEPVRTIIGFINKMISGIESGINFVIRGINSLSFDVPDWVPEIGGETFGFNLSEISLPQIPQLAKGGIVSKATLAMIGENGAEAVVPLEKNTGWISAVADDLEQGLLGRFKNLKVDIMPNIPKYQNTFVKADVDSSYNQRMVGEIDFHMASLSGEITRQNRLIEEQNRLLEAIYEKPTLSSREAFEAVRKEWNAFGRRTRKNPAPIY